MKTNKKCKWFKLHELLPPELYNGEDQGWDLIEDSLKETIDFLRELFGVPLTINNWNWGGSRIASGIRPETGGIGVSKSRHRIPQADAADMISSKMTTQEMWDMINLHQDELPYPIRVERTYISGGKRINCTWLHVDMANNKDVKVYYFNA